jgi:hypothetical protein
MSENKKVTLEVVLDVAAADWADELGLDDPRQAARDLAFRVAMGIKEEYLGTDGAFGWGDYLDAVEVRVVGVEQ